MHLKFGVCTCMSRLALSLVGVICFLGVSVVEVSSRGIVLAIDGGHQEFVVGETQLPVTFPNPKGNYVISENIEESVWKRMYVERYGVDFETHDFTFSKINNALTVRIALEDVSYGAIEYVQVHACGSIINPSYSHFVETEESVVEYISADDLNVVVSHEGSIEVSWEIPASCDRPLALSLKANAYEASEKNPFIFPIPDPKNQVWSQTYDYRQNGHLTVDGSIAEVDSHVDANYSPYWKSGTGHPSGNTYIYLLDDQEYVYLAVDVTGDNTKEFGSGWLKIVVYNTVTGQPKEYRVDDYFHEYGQCGFGLTSKVSYRHETCEIRIPKSEIEAGSMSFSLSYYGTFSPGGDFVGAIVNDGVSTYVGGTTFTIFGGMDVGIVKIDDETGEKDSSFDFSYVDDANYVYVSSLALSGGQLYASGYWNDGFSSWKEFLVKIDATTGEVDDDFEMDFEGYVGNNSLLVANDSLYAGGYISKIGGSDYGPFGVAKLDLDTGEADENFVVPFDGFLGDGFFGVNSLAANDSELYIGGEFCVNECIQEDLIKVTFDTGEVNEFFSSELSHEGESWYLIPYALEISGGNLYVGGYPAGDVSGSEYASAFVLLNADTGARDTDCDVTVLNGGVLSISVSGEYGFVGGQFETVDGNEMINLFGFNADTCSVDFSWTPEPTSEAYYSGIYAISAVGPDLWIGGEFNIIDGEESYGLAHYFLDSSAPEIVLAPILPNPTSDSMPVFSGIATDVGGTVSVVEFKIDSQNWNACVADDMIFDEASEVFGCEVPQPLSDGFHTVFLRSTDSNENMTPSGSEVSQMFLLDTVGPSFENLPGMNSVINLVDGQTVTERIYTIRVKPADGGLGSGISKVEFYVDGTLICTDTDADEEGVYGCSWDTVQYHSDVHIVVFDGAGNTVELNRTVFVDLAETGDEVFIPIIVGFMGLILSASKKFQGLSSLFFF